MKWLLAIAVLLVAIGFTTFGLDRLAKARSAERSVAREVREPAFDLPPGGAITASDAGRAAEVLAWRIGDAASQAGVRLESRPADPPLAGFVALDIVVTGPEPAVRDLTRRLEGGPRLLRLVVGSMRPTPGGVTLRARAVAPWRQ